MLDLENHENKLSAPKPRRTATSWTDKPLVVIPATIFCLILWVSLMYWMLPEPAHPANLLDISAEDPNLLPEQIDPSATSMLPENQTPPKGTRLVYYDTEPTERGDRVRWDFFFRIFGLNPGDTVTILGYGTGTADLNGVASI
eukprot:295546_1